MLGRIPASRLYQTGPEHPEAVPAAEHRQRPGASELQLRDHRGRRRASCRGSRRSASTTSRRRSCARRSSTRRGCSADQVINGTLPGFNDTQMQTRRSSSYTASVNYTLNADDVPRGDVRAQPERAGRLRAGAVGDRRDLLQQRRGQSGRADDAVGQPGQRRTCRTCRSCSRTRPCSIPATTPSRRSTSCSPAFWDGTRMSKLPTFQWGSRVAERAAEASGSPAGSTSTRPRTSRSA